MAKCDQLTSLPFKGLIENKTKIASRIFGNQSVNMHDSSNIVACCSTQVGLNGIS